MLIEFGACNYFSFKEWFQISFELNGNCPSDISEDEKYSKMIGIKGGNASGKTNILKALNFLYEFCYESFQKKPESEIDIKSYFDNKNPSEFYMDFILDNVTYRYELVATSQKVISEVIYRKLNRLSKVIERKENNLTFFTKEFEDLSKIKLRDNCSLISTARQYEVNSTKELSLFFTKKMSNITSASGHIDWDNHNDLLEASEFYYKNKDYFDFSKKIIEKSDTGVSNISIHEAFNSEGKKFYYPSFEFKTADGNKALNFGLQSSGTKVLYIQLVLYYFILKNGGILIMDEFDIKLHPFIAPFLLELFKKEKNIKNAQIIFTTHNTEILDFLGKYRTYLVNKENNESYTYRLDEIPGDLIRNDRPISPIYKEGKIGGVPRLDYES